MTVLQLDGEGINTFVPRNPSGKVVSTLSLSASTCPSSAWNTGDCGTLPLLEHSLTPVLEHSARRPSGTLGSTPVWNTRLDARLEHSAQLPYCSLIGSFKLILEGGGAERELKKCIFRIQVFPFIIYNAFVLLKYPCNCQDCLLPNAPPVFRVQVCPFLMYNAFVLLKYPLLQRLLNFS